ncbi:hypothetical protein EWM62_15020 [Mucilaginibacter terrigena]|uniref:Uncharacterized protein n=1 Tax=Mucilaginibacter terrigena TaxID=2492395 RepID=A0A4Q5LLP4_9SPHI|nr:hypothetical protein [Mucilaginibacter terrigena]RYU89622.1 hypothetical protein EWM62_15020 [Mucilaginibacter terrigena]
MKKHLLLFIILFTATTCFAQTVLKNGDKHTKKIYIRSNTVFQQGKRAVNIKSNSFVSRGYTAEQVSDNIFSFKITTDKITDTVKTDKQQINYSSDKAIDTSSFIEKSLNDVRKKILNVISDKSGILTVAFRTYLQNKNDSLLAFSGLLPDQLIVGNPIDLIVKLPYGYSLTKGTQWKSTIATVYGKQVLTFTVESTGPATSIISFKGGESKNYDNQQSKLPIRCYFNTNISGKMRVDNKSLIVKERNIKTASSGYQSINGVVFTVAKRSSISEIVD